MTTHITNTARAGQRASAEHWLQSPKGDTEEARIVRNLKKVALRNLLAEYGTERFTDLRPDAAQRILEALGAPLGGCAKTTEPVERIPSVGLTPKSPIERKREEMMLKRAAQAAAERRAEERGELWTAMASYKPNGAFIVLKHGRMDESWVEAFRSQHTDAYMTLEPTPLIGKLSEVRCQAVRDFTGTAKGEVTVRIIGD